ncbi:MAG: universal stress protein [Polyangiales bacterium]
MANLRKILVPVDFTEASDAARRKAEQLAGAVGAELVVLHVVDDTPMMVMDGAGVGYVPPIDTVGPYEAAAKERLERSAREGAGVVRNRLAHGRPEAEILRAAEEEGADLIVMGTHGRRGFERFLLGSVAERVVRTAQVPVLTVRT